MGKGGYLGGGTRISPGQNPDWFGTGSVEDEAYLLAQEKFQEAQAYYRKLLKERDAGAKGQAFRKRLEAARDAMDAARPRPRKASNPQAISPTDERRIAMLKRDMAAYAKRIQGELAAHEAMRQELITLLTKHNIPLTSYPETRKLNL